MLYFFAVIDWRSVWTNGLWILGTAVLIGTFSYLYWLTQIESRSLSELSQKSPFAQLIWTGLTFVLLGLIFTSTRWWETAVWLLLTGWAIYNLTASLRSAK